MTDEKLIETGRACLNLCSPELNYGKPRDVWTEQLKVLREEWRRRHPKTAPKGERTHPCVFLSRIHLMSGSATPRS